MFAHIGSQYLRQCLDLEVSYALWQPGRTFTREATALLVYQHGVERPGTPGLDAEVLFGVDVVVVK